MKKLLLSAIVILGFSAFSFGQATANASATIIRPITISKIGDLSFGNISAGVAGTVTLDPATGNRTASTGVVLPPTQTGTVSLADFTVSGEGGSLYTITLPSSDQSITSGANSITLNTCTSSLGSTNIGTLSSTIGNAGTQDVKVGATLNLLTTTATGSYTGTFSVTVNYN